MSRLVYQGVCAWFACALFVVGVARAAPDPDPYEARMRQLGEELRCLVCQNQTIADSQSGLAEDMRREMRAMMARGMSDAQITEFLVQRYGDFVRYRPPVKSSTAVLWYGPGLATVAGLVFLVRAVRRGAARGDSTLDESERARLDAVLAEGSHERIGS